MSPPPMAAPQEAPSLTSPVSQNIPQTTSYTPLPTEYDPMAAFLPKPSFPSDPSSERNSGIYDQSSPATSGFLLAKREAVSQETDSPVRPKPKRRAIMVVIVIGILLVVIVAIVVPVYFTVIKPKNASATGSSTTANGPQPSGSSGAPGSSSAVFGGDGSTVRASNGSTFTYNNKLGGICEF